MMLVFLSRSGHPERFLQALGVDEVKRNAAQREKIVDYFMRSVAPFAEN